MRPHFLQTKLGDQFGTDNRSGPLDLKTGQTVLEQRAREELGLTRDDEVYFQFVEPEDEPSGVQP